MKYRCRDDTVPKTVDTRKHCKVGLRACNNLPQPPLYIFVFRGCGRLLHALNPTLQCFLVSTVFGTVSSPAKRKSQRRTWILPCEGTRFVLYTKDHACSKMRPFYVKIMVYSPFSLAVGR